MAAILRAVTVTSMEHGIAILRMQQGENRVNYEMINAFNECLDKVESNPDCKGLITSGQGKFFCNGLDIQSLGKNKEALEDFSLPLNGLLARILTFPMPTVAAINGHCYAAGGMLAMAHDWRVMNGDNGWFCLNEVFLGLPFPSFGMKLLKSKLDPHNSRNLILSGKRLTGPEAEFAGVIDKCAQSSELEQECQKILKEVMGKKSFPRKSLSLMKANLFADAMKDVNVKAVIQAW